MLAFDSVVLVGSLINAVAVVAGPVLAIALAHMWRQDHRRNGPV